MGMGMGMGMSMGIGIDAGPPCRCTCALVLILARQPPKNNAPRSSPVAEAGRGGAGGDSSSCRRTCSSCTGGDACNREGDGDACSGGDGDGDGDDEGGEPRADSSDQRRWRMRGGVFSSSSLHRFVSVSGNQDVSGYVWLQQRKAWRGALAWWNGGGGGGSGGGGDRAWWSNETTTSRNTTMTRTTRRAAATKATAKVEEREEREESTHDAPMPKLEDADGGAQADAKANAKLVDALSSFAYAPTSTTATATATPTTTTAATPTSTSPSRAAPPHWHDTYARIEVMRKARDAPVDSMGCERLASGAAAPATFRFQTLIGLMLSSQTKDPVTAEAMNRLNAHWSDGLTLANVRAADTSTINQLICKVGFHNRKAEYIKRTAEILHEQYADDIPDTVDGLMALPGVGPKMAYLAMQCAWHRNVGIGVDVHVHRICNRLGWMTTKTPEETRKDLESWLPRELWRDINLLLVGFGQTVCLPVGPRCLDCSASEHCVEGQKNLRKLSKGARVKHVSKDEAMRKAASASRKRPHADAQVVTNVQEPCDDADESKEGVVKNEPTDAATSSSSASASSRRSLRRRVGSAATKIEYDEA